MKNFTMICTLLTGILLGISVVSFAEEKSGAIYIDVGQAKVKKSVLALPPLKYFGTAGDSKSNISIGNSLYETIFKDLDASYYFTFLNPDGYLEDPAKVGLKPAPGEPGGFNFSKWQTSGAEFLIRAGYRVTGNKVTLDAYLYHVHQAKNILAKSYSGEKNAITKLAHTFANDLVEALTGKKGIFLTKLIAVRQTNGAVGNAISKEIYILDWDGSDVAPITNHDSISTSPAWSRSGTKIAYTSFAYHKKQKVRNADLFVYELDTKKRFLVSYRRGINSGADFFPGDNQMLLTLSRGGQANIFKMSADGKTVNPITNGPAGAMNVEPAISPDGSKVAFSSDRSGRPMVYIMNADGSNPQRITFAGKYNSTPAWSPDGKTLAFAGQDKGNFDIYTIGADKKGLKRITSAKKKDGKG
ncbi:MAG: translocation protein TolB, partial [Bdellovibrionales bacterium]|nr:translocation protein TolB [Bdellovibrionales bacterium]